MRDMTARQSGILKIMEDGRLYNPRDMATALTNAGISSHPSAAAKTMRQLTRRGLLKSVPEDLTVPMLKSETEYGKAMTETFLYQLANL